MQKKLYLAAPLFSESERQYNCYLRELLQSYFDVYLPQEDGKLLVNLVRDGMNVDDAENLIFSNDINAIAESDTLLILLDGRTVDEGAAFELGYAYSLGKQCIGLQTGPRRLLPTGNNPMLKCALTHIFESTASLVEWCKKAAIQAPSDYVYVAQIPLASQST